MKRVAWYYWVLLAGAVVALAYWLYSRNRTVALATITDLTGVQTMDTTKELIYEELVKENKPQFLQKVREVAARLGVQPNWLMAIMKKESGLNSKAVNKQKGDSSDAATRAASRATGLIQFMPDTAKYLGTTNIQLYNMSNLQQLDYVEKYFNFYKGKLKSYPDLYLATFYPLALSKPLTFVIGSEKSPERAKAIAEDNPTMKSPTGLVTKQSFYDYVWKGEGKVKQFLT